MVFSVEDKALIKNLHLLKGCGSLSFLVDDHDCDKYRKISFIVEPLKLSLQSKYGRHYSPQPTICSQMIYATSSAAYTVLKDEKVLCLPSTSTLKKVTRCVGGNTGLDNSAYLQMRVSKLNQYQQTVLLIVDKIYVAKRIEYTSSGAVQGLTADGSVVSTLLCFMVKSLAAKYKDIVAIFPTSKLTATKLTAVSFNVVAISVDNLRQTESLLLTVCVVAL